MPTEARDPEPQRGNAERPAAPIAMRRSMRDWLLLAAIILVPRYYLWGTVPAGMHGDEGGFASLGAQMFSAPLPLWSFGPQSLPNAHLWLYGAGLHVLGYSLWSARFVTSLFGVLQALAVVDIARRTAGMAAAVTAALVTTIPLQLHFDRLAMCNVMTTATWALALWCVVRFPRHFGAAAAAGMLLALGWYGYQGSRIAPLIAAVALLPLLLRATTRRSTLRLTAAGLIGFAVVIAPLALGFYQQPQALFGRARDTAWLQLPGAGWPMLTAHLRATGSALLGLRYDSSGGFFPFDIPLVPIGLIAVSAVGLFACREAALRRCLSAWIVLVLAGNVLRHNYYVYSPVLVCLAPALALAAAYSVRWLRWFAPLVVAAAIAQPLYAYFTAGTHAPVTEIVPMAQAALLRDMDGLQPVVIAGGVGCGHGMTAFALHGRTCISVSDRELPQDNGAQLFILFPSFFRFDQALAERGDLTLYQRQWNTTGVHIWSSIPLPQGSPAHGRSAVDDAR
jgi:4-amino-4-deoxy-L-arabinose transferase-like glycosyltransferase